jgi:peroxiredoxin
MGALRVGETAPDFDLPAVTGEQRHRVRLSDFRGKKNVILVFYALNWTPV